MRTVDTLQIPTIQLDPQALANLQRRRVQAHDGYLRHEHKICLIAAKHSREDGDMAGAADFLHDAAMNRQMMIIERGQAHA